MKEKICELCRKAATVYCGSDHAFLCWTCDEEVHGANFLVARHLRHLLCSNCKAFAGDSVSGVGLRRWLRSPTCRNCSPEDDSFPGEDQSDSSSVCVSCDDSKPRGSVRTKRKTASRVCSSTEISGVEDSPARFSDEVSSCKKSRKTKEEEEKRGNDQTRPRLWTRFDAKAEGIFGNWCRDLGLNGNSAIAVVSAASNALRLCVERAARALPFRVFLAASFWYGLRCYFVYNNSARASHCLRRIEQVSGVPAKLILAVGLKIERESRAQNSRRRDLEEGWAECSG